MSIDNEFSQLGISDKLVAKLNELSFTIATEIQAKSIPSVLMGKDMVGISKTGSGKTLAFLLPMLDILADKPSRHKMPKALIICPTRELATQIFEVCKLIDDKNEVEVSLLIGGVNPRIQIRSLENSNDIVIATPGRLLEFVESQSLLLSGVDFLVLDEADRMLDMGFIEDIRKILKFLPKNCQSLLFSATIPKDIEDIINKLMISPKKVEVTSQHTNLSIKQSFHAISNLNRNSNLLSLVEKFHKRKIIIFCSRITEVDKIHDLLLKNFGKSNTVLSIHGDIEQSLRLKIINTFKTEKLGILVCSDLASRGLDIPLVEYVINYSLPYNVDSYVHRIGRTGRAGAYGQAHSLVNPKDDKTVIKGVIKKYGQETIEMINFDQGSLNQSKPKRTFEKNSAANSSHPQKNTSKQGYKQFDKKNNQIKARSGESKKSRNDVKDTSKKYPDQKFNHDSSKTAAESKIANIDNNSKRKVRQFTEDNMPDFLKVR